MHHIRLFDVPDDRAGGFMVPTGASATPPRESVASYQLGYSSLVCMKHG